MVFYLIQYLIPPLWYLNRSDSLGQVLTNYVALLCIEVGQPWSRQTPEVAQWPFTVPRSQAVRSQWVYNGGVGACAWESINQIKIWYRNNINATKCGKWKFYIATVLRKWTAIFNVTFVHTNNALPTYNLVSMEAEHTNCC